MYLWLTGNCYGNSPAAGVLKTSVNRLESRITFLIYNVTRCCVFKIRYCLYTQQEEVISVPRGLLLQYSA